SPNRGKSFDTLEELGKFDWPVFSNLSAIDFATRLDHFPRGSLDKMSLQIKGLLKKEIFEQLPSVREEFTIFDVTRNWYERTRERAGFLWSRPSHYFGMEDFLLYEAVHRAFLEWIADLRRYSSLRSIELLTHVRMRIARSIEN